MPMKSFYVDVEDVKEGVKLMNTLGEYDAFQFENNIKPNYSNAGGLSQLDKDGEWEDWECNDENLGYFNDPEEYIEALGGRQ